MSLATNVTDLATRVASQSKLMLTLISGNAADLSGLNTTAKSSLISAINEVAASVAGAGASIVDGAPSTGSVWSSSKTNTQIGSAVSALVDSSPAALDTLKELAAALGDNPNFAATMTAALGAKAPLASPAFTGTPTGITKSHVGLGSVDNTSDLTKPISTATQTALNGKPSNTDVGDTGTNFVAVFEAGLV